jgi:chloramphenicol O-acetyltransferase type A
MAQEDLFTFCTIDYTPDFTAFAAQAAERIAFVREHPTLKDETGRDDYLFMTSIPWVTFTSFSHPGHLGPATSIPMIAWGKLSPAGRRRKMPLCIKVHHAVVDGIHLGRYFEGLQALFDEPILIFGADR